MYGSSHLFIFKHTWTRDDTLRPSQLPMGRRTFPRTFLRSWGVNSQVKSIQKQQTTIRKPIECAPDLTPDLT